MAAAKRHIVILGSMGVGKSTTGRALAESLSVAYVDSDDDLRRLFGQPGAQIASEHGLGALHELEAGVLLGALARPGPTVITAAASVVERPLVLAALRKRAFVVWLTASTEVVLARQKDGDHRRPMTSGELVALEERRRSAFELASNLQLVAEGSPDELARRIVAAEIASQG